jgi:hypothetical protein
MDVHHLSYIATIVIKNTNWRIAIFKGKTLKAWQTLKKWKISGFWGRWGGCLNHQNLKILIQNCPSFMY